MVQDPDTIELASMSRIETVPLYQEEIE